MSTSTSSSSSRSAACTTGAGDLGEMLSTADRIVDGDAESWCPEWIATGQRVAAIADGCTKGGHNKSARAAYMRAAAYFTVALSSVDSTKDPAALLGPTFGEHRRCFDAYAELMDPAAEKVGSHPDRAAAAARLWRQAELRSILRARDAGSPTGATAEVGVARVAVLPELSLRCLYSGPPVQPR
jgi:hypothetical protein